MTKPGQPSLAERIRAIESAEEAWVSLEEIADAVEALTAENERLQDVLDTERYKVAIGVQAIARAVQGRRWLSQLGRGSYAYDDERYQQEFGAAIDEIHAALRPLQTIAQDWSDCPRDPLRVEANRRAALTPSQEGEG